MHYDSLRDFIKVLEEEKELVRISSPVSPYLEIAEITDRMSKAKGGGKALLFESVVGSDFPVITNAFGSKKRIALALGVEKLEELSERLHKLVKFNSPRTFREKVSLFAEALHMSSYLPRLSRIQTPPCQEVVLEGDRVDLTKLPILHSWPGDAGPFITLALVCAKGLTSGKRNIGVYRLQVFDRNTTGIHWHIHKDGAQLFREYQKEGKRMEVAVVIGTDPALTYAATAPMPRGMDELLLAGFIRRKPVKLVKALSVDLEVPATAEIILEGYVDPDDMRLEGPFGDHTGCYSLPDMYPLFHVQAITHRKKALYSTIVVGRPPMEDCYLGLATERIFLPLLQTILPEITDYFLPWEGGFHNIVVIAIEKEYPGHVRKAAYGLWGSGQMSFCKALVFVDAPVHLTSESALMVHILSHLDLTRDVFITDGILDALDHASPTPFWGGKISLDATTPLDGESTRLPLSQNDAVQEGDIGALKALDDDIVDMRLRFPGLPLPILAIAIRKSPQKPSLFFRNLMAGQGIVRQGIIILYDASIDLTDDSLILWKACNNVDPLRDIILREQLMIIDASSKHDADGHRRPWPEDAVMSEEIKRVVQSRLHRWGITHLFEDPQ